MLLSEMFGVERDTDFMVEVVKGSPLVRFRIRRDYAKVEYLERYSEEDGWQNAREIFKVIYLAPSGIIRLPPPLTDEQREQLKALWTLGGRWLAEDEEGDIFAYDSKPHKIVNYCRWNNDKDGECFTVIRDLSVCSLVSWSDNEPYDIGKALGVEG